MGNELIMVIIIFCLICIIAGTVKQDWRVRIPKFRAVRPVHAQLIAEDIVKRYLHWSFWISFIGWYQIWKWIEPHMETIKGWILI